MFRIKSKERDSATKKVVLTDDDKAANDVTDDDDRIRQQRPMLPRDVSIILVPGIAGNGTELAQLAGAIVDQSSKDNKDRPVYVYTDKRILNGTYQRLPINCESTHLAKVMEQMNPWGPYVLVTYSYSSVMAAEVMKYFADKGRDVFVYIIDAPAPELSKKFFNHEISSPKHAEHYVNGMVDMVNYTASIHPSTESRRINKSQLSQKEINQLKSLPASACLENLSHTIAPEGLKGAFANNIDCEQRRLDRLAHYERAYKKPMRGTMEALICNQTVEKYGDQFGGWIGYAEKESFVGYKYDDVTEKFVPNPADKNATELLSANHQDLVRDPFTVNVLAQSINDFIDRNITLEYLVNYTGASDVDRMEKSALAYPQLREMYIRMAQKLQALGPAEPAAPAAASSSPVRQSPVTPHVAGHSTSYLLSKMPPPEAAAKLKTVAVEAVDMEPIHELEEEKQYQQETNHTAPAAAASSLRRV